MAAAVPAVRVHPRQLVPDAPVRLSPIDGEESSFTGFDSKKNEKIGEDRNVLFSLVFLFFWLGNRITGCIFGEYFNLAAEFLYTNF